MQVELVAATAMRIPVAEGVTQGEGAVAFAMLSDVPSASLLRRNADDLADSRAGLLEHASATLHVRGVSRDAAAAIRGHGLAVSERGADGAVVPAAIAADEELTRLFDAAVEEAEFVRGELLRALEDAMADEPNALVRRKRAREAADALVPAAAETELVATGTYRAWREFIAAHNGRFEHEEIRQLAGAVLDVMQREAPLLFGDLAEGERR
ncbi:MULTISPECIES: FAD-dependent thymidylate synthase [unclassified Corynebacterium]|uniref:FAD-dependent thymidylate synthase n=1 Tax=unclassified Corynebacterium TaxID=2624378 RepID=UPI001EF54C94|nr:MULTISPECIES: FAD-dependent thymidylate synthase [unclassified Corynebacterium]MCG7289793.1 FAD-dependent thymidylate synthase [Corynebacterium sp. ACRPZ]MCG7294512.1 FAD-dependent thymidylate synthase [Corynebacterium sp. ACRPY]MDL0402442.1 FAD-dependent thymidylate synthase [Corynebacterium lehmanniae]